MSVRGPGGVPAGGTLSEGGVRAEPGGVPAGPEPGGVNGSVMTGGVREDDSGVTGKVDPEVGDGTRGVGVTKWRSIDIYL